MKSMALLCFSLFATVTTLTTVTWAAPALFVENTTEYSAYYTRIQAGKDMRSFNGCVSQVIGSIVFEDCMVKMMVKEGETYLPPESDKDMRCHFEYQSYNPDFFKILVSSCL